MAISQCHIGTPRLGRIHTKLFKKDLASGILISRSLTISTGRKMTELVRRVDDVEH